MLYLLDGLYKDIIILLVVSIALGAALSVVSGKAAHRYFGNTVVNLIGDYGEHDLVLTINAGLQKQSLEQLKEILSTGFPEGYYKKSITIAGKTNIFVTLGEGKNKETYQNFLKELTSLTGLSSYNIVSEPRLSIKGIPAGAVEILEEALKDQEGLDFIMYTARSLEIFLKDPSYLPALNKRVEELVNSYRLVSLPASLALDLDHQAMGDYLKDKLAKDIIAPIHNITSAGAESPTLMEEKISRMEDLLVGYTDRIFLPKIRVAEGTKLYLLDQDNLLADIALPSTAIPLLVYRSSAEGTTALILEELVGGASPRDIYASQEEGVLGNYLGKGDLYTLPLGMLNGESDSDLSLLLPQIKEAKESLLSLQDQLKEFQDYEATWEKMQEELTKTETSGLAEPEKYGELVQIFNNLLDSWEEFWLNLNFLKDVSETWPQKLEGLEKILAVRRLFLAPTSPLEEKLGSLEEDVLKLKEILAGTEDALAVRLGNLDKVRQWRSQLKVIEGFLADNQEVALSDYFASFAEKDGALNGALKGNGSLPDLTAGLLSTLELLKGVEQLEQPPALQIDEEEILQALLTLQDLRLSQAPADEEVMLMIPAGSKEDVVGQKIRDILGAESPQPQFKELGVFRPDMRGEIFRLIGEVRLTLTALVALGISLVLLILDHTVAMSLIKTMRVQKYIPVWLRPLTHESLYGFLVGSFTLWGMIRLAGGEIPYLNGFYLFLIGGILGILVSFFAHKLNPISKQEFVAGVAMGMSLPKIVREIVLPSARPSIFFLLNRCNQIFI